MILTYRYRIKDRSSGTRRALREQARSVNFVWNFCAETDRAAHRRYRMGAGTRRPTAFDLIKLTAGCAAALGLHSDTVSAVCSRFVAARRGCFPKTPRFRSFKRNLDWIPVSTFDRVTKLEGDRLTFRKRAYHLWLSRPLPEERGAWSFSTDARGRWYVNISAEVPEAPKRAGAAVGIDLGLKDLAVSSDGERIEAPRFYRRTEEALGIAQRRGQKARARSLAAKVANQRRHFLHVNSTRLVRRYATIRVGNVGAAQLAKTNMAKSVHDAGWTMFRDMLQYKSIATGACFEIVDERYTTQTCSECGVLGGPKGIAGLGMREWRCLHCDAVLDRDVNAATNILGAERRPLAEEIRAL